MSIINPLSSSTTPQTASSSQTMPTNANSMVSEKNFFTLLSAELKYQNPTKPVQSTQFIAELAQFSSLSAETSMQSSLKTLVQMSQQTNAPILNGAALIGKTVTTASGSGTVTSANYQNHTLSLTVSGLGAVPLSAITAVQ